MPFQDSAQNDVLGYRRCLAKRKAGHSGGVHGIRQCSNATKWAKFATRSANKGTHLMTTWTDLNTNGLKTKQVSSQEQSRSLCPTLRSYNSTAQKENASRRPYPVVNTLNIKFHFQQNSLFTFRRLACSHISLQDAKQHTPSCRLPQSLFAADEDDDAGPPSVWPASVSSCVWNSATYSCLSITFGMGLISVASSCSILWSENLQQLESDN